MNSLITLSGNLQFIVALFCLIFVFKIGRVGMSLLIVCATLFIKEMVDSYILLTYYSREVTSMVVFAFWYASFIFTNLAAIISVHVFHKIAPARFSIAARVYTLCCAAHALIFFLRGFEQIYTETHYFQSIYRYGIPILNYFFIFFIVYALRQAYTRSKDFPERISWNIS